MALPPTLAVTTNATTLAASSQWNRRVGRSQMRMVWVGMKTPWPG